MERLTALFASRPISGFQLLYIAACLGSKTSVFCTSKPTTARNTMSTQSHDAPTLARTPSKLDVKELEKDVSASPSEAPTIVDDNERYLSGSRLLLVFVGMLMSILLIALDQTIVCPV